MFAEELDDIFVDGIEAVDSKERPCGWLPKQESILVNVADRFIDPLVHWGKILPPHFTRHYQATILYTKNTKISTPNYSIVRLQ